MFPLGLARTLLRALLAEIFVPIQRVISLHFYLYRLLVGPPWDPRQQVEICRKLGGKRRVGYGLIWSKVNKASGVCKTSAQNIVEIGIRLICLLAKSTNLF